MPLAVIFEHLDEQISIEVFLDAFPSVTREHVRAVLAFMLRSLDQQPQARREDRARDGTAPGQLNQKRESPDRQLLASAEGGALGQAFERARAVAE